MAVKKYGVQDWEHEASATEGDGRFGVHYLTIVDPDGGEVSVIIHRTGSAEYPTDRIAQMKMERALKIVSALNATMTDVEFEDDFMDDAYDMRNCDEVQMSWTAYQNGVVMFNSDDTFTGEQVFTMFSSLAGKE